MTSARAVPVPQTVGIVKIVGALVEVLAKLAMLPPRADGPAPYLEVVIALDRPEPRLRTTIETALDGKHARLVALRVEATGDGAALADRVLTARRLAELDPRDVFGRLWARDHAEPPPADVLAGFERLLAEVEAAR